MQQYAIADPSLWESGERKIRWVRDHMPLLRGLEAELSEEKPFDGLRVALSVHLEAKTAYLCVAAALVRGGMRVFARHGCDMETYREGLCRVVEGSPQIVIDDGGDLVHLLHTAYRDLLPHVIGGCEETTTGILRLRAMEREGALRFPMISVNDADCKHLFDNRYGTGQSVWDAIDRTTNLIVAGKTVVVAGYGWCGKGVAMRAKGLGASVVVTEVDPIKAMEAVMDGFRVLPMAEACPIGDLFITVTGDCGVVTTEHFPLLKEGAILANAGHFDVEVDMQALNAYAVRSWEARDNITGYELPDGKTVYVLAEGRLVNLGAGDGHPAEIMDLSFAVQAMSARYLVKNRETLSGGRVISVPREVDLAVARRRLDAWGVRIDHLTDRQAAYLASWDPEG